MSFSVAVDDEDGFKQYITSVAVIAASVAWLFLLFLRSVQWKLSKYSKLFNVAMSLQLLFATLRNLSTLMLSSGFAVNCQRVAIIGGAVYPLFAIAAECSLLIRCRSFTRHPNVVTALAIPVWLLRLALCLWLVMTIQAEDNVLGAVCAVSMNFELATIMQYIKILSECIILFFFLEQIVSLHRGSRGLNIDMDCRNNNHWRHLGVINSAITFMVILSEVYVGVVTIRQQDYLLVTYSMVNLYQATLVVCIVEDTRTTFKKRAQGCDVGQQDARSDRVAYFDGIAIGQLSSSAPFRHSYMAQRGEINRTNNIHHRHSMPVPKLARYALAESPGLPISCLSPIHGEGGGGIDVGADHGHSLPAVALVRERSLSSSHRVPVSMGIRAEEQQDTMVKATCSQID